MSITANHISRKETYVGSFGVGLLIAANPPSRLSRDGAVGGEGFLASGTPSVMISILIGFSDNISHNWSNSESTRPKE